MRLSSLAPEPVPLVSALAKVGIRTEVDLLFAHTRDDLLRKLPAGTTTRLELTEYITLVTQRASASHTRADSLLGRRDSELADRDITTGVPTLDDLFRGLGSKVLEISGDKDAGKTTVAVHAVLRRLVTDKNASAIWVDTTGEFTVERLVPVLGLYDDQLHTASGVLERFQVSMALDVDAVYSVLDNIQKKDGSSQIALRYVVIDTITEIFGPLLSAVSSQGHALMTTFMRQLRQLAQNLSLTILVINNAANVSPNNAYSVFFTTTKKPALGPSFTYLTDATIWLARSPDDANELRIAEIFRSKSVRSQRWCSFKIRNGLLVLSS